MADRSYVFHGLPIVVVFALFITFHFPDVVDYLIIERVIGVILASFITEFITDRMGIKADYGLVTYCMGLIHPGTFPFASAVMHGAMPSVPVISDLQALLLGNEYRARFRGNPNFAEIHSQHSATSSIAAIASETQRSYYLREASIFVMMLLALTGMHGASGVALACIGFALYAALQHQGGTHEVVRTKNTQPIRGRHGVYAIEISNIWTEFHVGVGYLYNGTFTTKYHVTNAKPIMIDDAYYEPCYYNTKSDIVCYGAAPDLCDVDDGDDIIVALSGPFSDVIVTYATKAAVNDDGYVMFTGRKSVPGTSGSPFFKQITTSDGKIEHRFAGCLGWSMRDPGLKTNETTEIAMNSGLGIHSKSLAIGDIIQHCAAPGSGKTRNITSLIQQGLSLYKNVYVVGPTRGVSMELVSAYEDNPIEGIFPRVLIKDIRNRKAPSRLTITTHATALRLLLRKDPTFTRPGLWVIDEAHFPDKATQCLKHYLRHLVLTGKSKSTLYEMTATAYDIQEKKWCYCTGSNYPITDTVMDKFRMIDKLKEEHRKAIVFVTSIKGKEHTSSHKLKETLTALGKKVIEVNRSNFTRSYPAAKTGEYDIVLATNIAECGVNLDVDVCYDFQEGPKPIVQRWDDIVIRSTIITKSQYIQRRGRVGRRKPGEYIGPHTQFELHDVEARDAYHLDVALFVKNFEIEPKDPIFMTEEASYYRCTHEQIMYLFAEGEDAIINSPLTLKMVVDTKGNLRDSDSVYGQAIQWNKSNEVSRTVGERTVFAKYWDDRDSDFYWNFKNTLDCEDNVPESERVRMIDRLRKNIHKIGRSLKFSGTWIRRPSVTPEYEVSDDEDDHGRGVETLPGETSTSSQPITT